MNRKIIAWYSILMGVSVLTMWIFIVASQQIPEGKTELSYHLVSEFVMATICLVSGVMLLRRINYAKGLNLVGLGMIAYSVLNAAGYYGEQGNTLLMIMFSLLCILTIAAILMNFRVN